VAPIARAIEENGAGFWPWLLQVAGLLIFAVVCYYVDPIVENDLVLAAAAVDGVLTGSPRKNAERVAKLIAVVYN
jgi:hypothetical protein